MPIFSTFLLSHYKWPLHLNFYFFFGTAIWFNRGISDVGTVGAFCRQYQKGHGQAMPSVPRLCPPLDGACRLTTSFGDKVEIRYVIRKADHLARRLEYVPTRVDRHDIGLAYSQAVECEVSERAG